jgi:hypothetical protein
MASTAQWATHSPQPVHFFLGDHRGDVAVLGHLAFAGGPAHAQVFDGPAEARHFVQLEMAHGHQALGLMDGLGQKHGFELLLVDLHLHFGLAGEAVGDDHRGPGDGIGEAVFNGGGEVAHGLGAGPQVQGVAVGEEGVGALAPELIHHQAHEIGADVGGVALFPEMELHRDQGPLFLALDDAFDLQGLEELAEFLEIGLLEGGAQVHEIDCAGHEVTFKLRFKVLSAENKLMWISIHSSPVASELLYRLFFT